MSSPVLFVRRYAGGDIAISEVLDGVSPGRTVTDGLLWIDLEAPDADTLADVGTRFGLHPLALEDAVEPGQRAKLELYPTHAFIVAYSSTLAEVDIFIGAGWVITVRERTDNGVWDCSAARARFERALPEDRQVGRLVHALLDDLVDGYFDALDDTEDRIEALEDAVFGTGTGEREVQQALFTLRRDLVAFRRKVVPMREVLGALLRGEVPHCDAESLVLLQDVYDHVLRVGDTIDSHRELMGNAVDAHLAIVSNQMNDVMKRMTSWGAILLGSTLVAGIYGMNFRTMPELDWRYGYPGALGLMLIITIVGFLYFRKRDWL